jgi:hypothetical protein
VKKINNIIIVYSTIILLAFKDFGEEFSKDRNRMKDVLAEYDNHMTKKNLDNDVNHC